MCAWFSITPLFDHLGEEGEALSGKSSYSGFTPTKFKKSANFLKSEAGWQSALHATFYILLFWMFERLLILFCKISYSQINYSIISTHDLSNVLQFLHAGLTGQKPSTLNRFKEIVGTVRQTCRRAY